MAPSSRDMTHFYSIGELAYGFRLNDSCTGHPQSARGLQAFVILKADIWNSPVYEIYWSAVRREWPILAFHYASVSVLPKLLKWKLMGVANQIP